MLQTLSKIGEQLLEGHGIWARLTIDPKTTEDKNQWVCPILFDCNEPEIRFMNLERYYPSDDPDTEPSSIKYKYINPDKWGRRGRKCALTVEAKNYTMLPETFFGKSGEGSPMLQSMKEFDSGLANSELFKAIENVYEVFNNSQEQLDLQKIKEHYGLGGNDEIVLFYALIRSPKIKNGETTPLNQLTGFEDLFIRKFGTPEGLKTGIDYVTGFETNETQGADFTGRYNIHKIFQTTTFNFASNFSDFNGNFRSSPDTLAALDKASGFILKKWNTYIAGVSHIIVPSFLHKDQKQIDLQEISDFILKSNELLFRLSEVETLSDSIVDQDIKIFWINYIAFESDGNSFKIMNHIKDVNSRYLLRLIEAFKEIEEQFNPYIKSKYSFTLQTIYNLVPIREQKAKNNEALLLFKDILEQHAIDPEILYKHFIRLIKCHRNGQFNEKGRHRSFTNIRKIESFDYAVMDACFKYHALFKILRTLNLMPMETTDQSELKPQEATSEFQNKVQEFFQKMNYPPEKQALFYLGRVLSHVAYAQYKKKHESKPVLNKLNFSGMDVPAIMRLSLDLNEKTRQYNIHYITDWDFARFREIFNEEDWPLSSEQNVFYLMTGYSFGLTVPKDSSGKKSSDES